MRVCSVVTAEYKSERSLRNGAGPRGVLPTLSQYMLSSAATFGFFLSIGSVRRIPYVDTLEGLMRFSGHT